MNNLFLATLWFIQLPLGAYTTYTDIIDLMMLIARQNLYRWPVYYPFLSFSSLLGFFLLLRELYLHYTSTLRLRPPYHILSNLYRVIQTTLYLSLLASTSRRGRYRRYSVYAWGRLGILLASYLTALTYGAWSWYIQQRHGHDSNSNDTSDENGESKRGVDSADSGMDLIPRTILDASHLISRKNLVIKLILWIYAPLHEIPSDIDLDFEERNVWRKLVGKCVWLLRVSEFCYMLVKRLIGTVPLFLLVPFHPRFPGELSLQTRKDNRSEWDYNRPKLGRHDQIQSHPQGNLSFPSSLQERRLLADNTHSDEEAALSTDLMSLHSISESNHIPPQNASIQLSNTQDVPDRQLGPAYLCFIDASSSTGYTTRHVSTWTRSHGDSYPDYIFISYTRLQFYTIISGDPSLPSSINARRRAAAERDMDMLIRFAIRATKAAGIDAFWIDYECIRPEEDEDADESIGEVYRICDIVRACHSMAIIVGPQFNYANYSHEGLDVNSPSTKAQWLQDWGSRLWTVPEALLCPAEHRISIYTPDTTEPELVAKRNLPGRVWDDAIALRQLIDHYESSIHLTKLELISIALECLKRRQTEKRMAGDVAYALQGLLRQRPRVLQSDSDFQAFARLSLANDSDMLLERLLCLKLKDHRAPWHEMQDVWGAKLWDITPICQISEVVENDTVILGDAKGAMINWAFLEAIDYEPIRPQIANWTLLRLGAYFSMIFVLFVAMMTVFLSRETERHKRITAFPFSILWQTFLGVFVGHVIAVPWVLRHLYGSEIHQTQARLYGISGRPELSRVEELMFGSDQGRLQWMERANSAADPLVGEEHGDKNGLRSFTLIDTCTLTAIPFEAELPPSVVLAGARTRGLVRMLLCSYDATAAKLCKEAVMQMETVVLDRMPKLNRVRFSLKPARGKLTNTE
ncbi:hypothetical protein sscle_16g108260 [Sclerotinia sclerotiorum 1980 UF-70]|uniref:Heterokaryon incompatibility domain-containing protein n=1 Tax=Sclerotinia sclerotiorum (strain ATCC 18683 / 1980 / Ss-1) TaxID=665079 RepID=A0A1D9QM95_SCLS1|nr:hypothetical protein sscle_16g108260 [Sclerotinia sclerotiorum 1980 UF-70]